jgi:hypothetical protein
MFETKVVEKIKTDLLCSVIFFSLKNLSVNEIKKKNIVLVEPGRSQMKTRCMHIACWISKAANTHSEYVIFIAFPLQQWLNESASVLRYMYIACCLVNIYMR